MAPATLTATVTSPLTPQAPPPATAIVTRAGGAGLPSYVTAEQARAVVDAAETTQHRLLLECLWQTGGRVSEVLRLRRGDVDPTEGAVRLVNLKQRRRDKARKLVYVSSSLVAADTVYGADGRFRQWLEATGRAYVVAVPHTPHAPGVAARRAGGDDQAGGGAAPRRGVGAPGAWAGTGPTSAGRPAESAPSAAPTDRG